MRRAVLMLVFGAIFTTACSAKDIYVAASAAGAGDGSSCSGARASSFFNSAANWGTGSTQIGPGTVVHVCGTISGSAGANGFTFQGNGTQGSPITLLFEAGAVMTSPAWGTAISSAGHSWVVIDGGSNGQIINTSNGTALGNQRDSAGVIIDSSQHIEVRNLKITNMYVRTARSSDTCDCGVGVQHNSSTPPQDVSIHNNTIANARNAIMVNYQGTVTGPVQIYSNVISGSANCIMIGDRTSGSTLSGLAIHDNQFSGGVEWDSAADTFHVEHVHLWAVQGSSQVTNALYYNNTHTGDCGAHCTAFLFVEGNITGITVFNSIFAPKVNASTNAELTFKGGANAMTAYNNVVDCGGINGNGVQFEVNISTGTFKNNVVMNCGNVGIDDVGVGTMNADYNIFYNNGRITSSCSTLSCWRSAGHDAHGMTSNPNLDANYKPTSSSPVLNAAVNLSSVGILALNKDKAGVARPATGSWDIGGYEMGGSVALPNPPSNLTASVQ